MGWVDTYTLIDQSGSIDTIFNHKLSVTKLADDSIIYIYIMQLIPPWEMLRHFFSVSHL